MHENILTLKDFSVVAAEYQTKGRGRYSNRTWTAPKGKNLCFNILVPTENLNVELYASITQIAAITIAGILKQNGINAKVKWPNDVLVNKHKICGIISELLTNKNSEYNISLGIGINVNTEKEDFKDLDKPATSILIETGRITDRNLLLNTFIEKFKYNFSILCTKGLQPFIEEWNKIGNFVGYKAKAINNGIVLEGVIEGIQNDGSLLFKTSEGLKTIWASDLEI